MNLGRASSAELLLNAPKGNKMDYKFEKEALCNGASSVCGIDEAGRGPLAGPVFAAAVILPVDCEIAGLNDSKKLTEKKRDELFDIIKEKAVAYGIASVDEKTIDEINILQADFVAMREAVKQLDGKADFALVDGNQYPNTGIKELAIVKGDSKSPSIAAASILAKVSRDRYMTELDKIYPEYQFAKHKGYGTKLHYECIEKYGVSPVHRKSFLKKIIGE